MPAKNDYFLTKFIRYDKNVFSVGYQLYYNNSQLVCVLCRKSSNLAIIAVMLKITISSNSFILEKHISSVKPFFNESSINVITGFL